MEPAAQLFGRADRRARRARFPNAGIEQSALSRREAACAQHAKRAHARRKQRVASRDDAPCASATPQRGARALARAASTGAAGQTRPPGGKNAAVADALIAPDGARALRRLRERATQARTRATAAAAFEAPWLGFRGTAELIDGPDARRSTSRSAAACSRAGGDRWSVLELRGNASRATGRAADREFVRRPQKRTAAGAIRRRRCATCSATSCTNFFTERNDTSERTAMIQQLHRRTNRSPQGPRGRSQASRHVHRQHVRARLASARVRRRSITPSTKRWRATRRTSESSSTKTARARSKTTVAAFPSTCTPKRRCRPSKS